MKFLVADCGSTKCDWIAYNPNAYPKGDPSNELQSLPFGVITTTGFNAAVTPPAMIADILQGAAKLPDDVEAVYFYGAGCIGGDVDHRMRQLLQQRFPKARIEVASDMIGAARALFFSRPGIACILGTGSNSCLYDGERIVANTPPLGYILGDEGSGASLGKRLVNNVFKGILPKEISESFLARYSLTKSELIEKVYRTPGANRYLASFAPFLAENIGHPAVAELVKEEFRAFITHNIEPYLAEKQSLDNLSIGFVGSIATHFSHQLREVLEPYNFASVIFHASPIDLLALYHASH